MGEMAEAGPFYTIQTLTFKPYAKMLHLEGHQDGDLGGALHRRGGLGDGGQHSRARVGGQVQVLARQRDLRARQSSLIF